MTRHQLLRLQTIAIAIPTRPEMASLELRRLIREVAAENAAEDIYHDDAELNATSGVRQ